MKKEYFDDHFRDFHFVGCAVRSKDAIYLLSRKEYEIEEGNEHPSEIEIDKRFLNIFLDRPEETRYGSTDLTQFGVTNICATLIPGPHAVAIDYKGHCYARGKGFTGLESKIPHDEIKGPQRGGMIKLKNIGGYVYAVGGQRSVCRREGPNQWVPLWDESLPVPKVKKNVDFNDYGFEAIDGFSPDDIYAAGGKGDVWHFDGKRWRQIPFPSNMDLYNVCCGGDGQVYIGAQSGHVFRGRGQKWEHICKGGISLRFEDMVWFQDSVWCTNDYGIWRIHDGKRSSFDLPAGICSCAGYASAADGIMVMAGMYGAAMHNGKEWVNLVDMPALYRQHGKKP
jgi:hypothetical protein